MAQSIKQAKRAVCIQAVKCGASLTGVTLVIAVAAAPKIVLYAAVQAVKFVLALSPVAYALSKYQDGLDKLADRTDAVVAAGDLTFKAAQYDLVMAHKRAVASLREQRNSECCPEQAMRAALELADQAKHEHQDDVATKRAELTEKIVAAEQALSAVKRKL